MYRAHVSLSLLQWHQGWHWAEPAEPRACSREPSQISPPLARLMRDSAWRAEPRASHYNGSARLAVTPRWLASSRLAQTARRAYMCNIYFVHFSSKVGWIVCYQVSTAKFTVFMNWLNLVTYNSRVWTTIDSICMLLSIRRQIQWSCHRNHYLETLCLDFPFLPFLAASFLKRASTPGGRAWRYFQTRYATYQYVNAHRSWFEIWIDWEKSIHRHSWWSR